MFTVAAKRQLSSWPVHTSWCLLFDKLFKERFKTSIILSKRFIEATQLFTERVQQTQSRKISWLYNKQPLLPSRRTVFGYVFRKRNSEFGFCLSTLVHLNIGPLYQLNVEVPFASVKELAVRFTTHAVLKACHALLFCIS